MDRFCNLHQHSKFSTLDAIIRIENLFARVAELGQSAIALTDHGNMAGMWEAYQQYKKYKDTDTPVKLIPGNEIYFCEDLTDPKAKRRHLVLLAANEVGYRNLLQITAAGFHNSVTVMGKEFPRVDEEILRRHSEGIYATSACGGSLIAASVFGGDRTKAVKAAELFKGIYGDRFFIELQPHNLHRGNFSQIYLNNQLKSIAEELNIEMVATCDAHYLTAAHEKYHDMVLAISSKRALDDPMRHRYASVDVCLVCEGTGVYPVDSTTTCHACLGTKISKIKSCAEFYVKSGQEVYDFFAKQYNSVFANKLIDNTAKIAAACENPDYMEPKGVRLPVFPWEDELDAGEFRQWKESKESLKELADDAAYLRFRTWKAFYKYAKENDLPQDEANKYWNRILKECDILEAQKFSSYMLIVADFVNWARNHGIAIGPARGSGAGSIVGFFLGIHTVDSIKYGLLFERFQSKLRKSPPDYDIDFSPANRDKVIEYCREKYGRDRVAYISNILRLTPKLAIKDISRSLCIGGDKSTAFKIANEITADIPDDAKTIKEALAMSGKLRAFVQEYPEVLDYANHISGLPRTFSTHAAGIVISDIPLDQYVPLRRDKEGRISVQFDKDTCEAFGLVKMDFLAIETLDVLDETYEMAKEVGLQVPDPNHIPENDKNAFTLIQSGHVMGVFQLAGSLAFLCKAMKPNSIKDIADINALGRPSCSQEERMNFINRKFGKSKIQYPHKILEPILNHTYGISVYDEDLLRIAEHVAGWDLSRADSLRKITKRKEKGKALAEKTAIDFVKDAQAHSGISQKDAQYIWDNVIIPFAKYGFCLSHAVAYSMISYYTSFYKVYATGPFFCALLNAETRGNRRDREESLDLLKRDAKRFKIEIVACDINISKQYYTMKDKRTITTGLGAVKGIGDKALNAIIACQPFSSFADFLHRTPSRVVNKTVIMALAKAGAFDSLGVSRKFALEHYNDMRKDLLKSVRKFDDYLLETHADSEFSDHEYDKEMKAFLKDFSYKNDHLKQLEWSLKEKLFFEREVLGEYVSGTANDLFPNFFRGGAYSQSFSRIVRLPEGANFATEGLVASVREITIKKPGRNQGKTMAKLVVENLKGETVDVTIWPDAYAKSKKYLNPGVPLRGLFSVNEWNGTKSLVLVNLEAIFTEKIE